MITIKFSCTIFTYKVEKFPIIFLYFLREDESLFFASFLKIELLNFKNSES